MKRKLIYIAAALATLALGVWVASMAHSMAGSYQGADIPQQEFVDIPVCVEVRTPDEFSTFWAEFRGAVEREEKEWLSRMIRRCNFEWTAFAERLRRPLETDAGWVPFQLEAPFQIRGTLPSNWGTGLRFRSYDDYVANYDVVYSKSIKQRILRGEPRPIQGCDYAISWRQNVLHHLCFDKDASGYKFSGFQFEP